MAEARAMAADLEARGVGHFTLDAEDEAARRGAGAAYDARWSVPPGEHHARLAGGAFWGAEVSVGWGPELVACAERLARLFDESASLDPMHRRFGAYAGHHAVSLGVQVLGRRSPDAVAALRDRVRDALPDLVARGGVPYRAGNLWRPTLDAHPEARAASAAVARVRAALDPDGVFPGPVDGTP